MYSGHSEAVHGMMVISMMTVRAGFVKDIYTKKEQAVGHSTAKNISRDYPGYIINQEKNNEEIFKMEDRLEPVHGEAGMSRDKIIEKDKEIKRAKRGRPGRVLDVEPKANRNVKKRLLKGRTREAVLTKRR